MPKPSSCSGAVEKAFQLFYPPSSPWVLLSLRGESFQTSFKVILHILRVSLDRVSGDVFGLRLK